MSNPEDPQQPPTPPQGPSRTIQSSNVALIPRLGNIQAVVEFRGEGVYRRPLIRFSKLIPAEALRHDPSMLHVYEVEEVATLRQLCDNILRDCYATQTLVPQDPARPPTPVPGQPFEKPPIPQAPPPAPPDPPKSAKRRKK